MALPDVTRWIVTVPVLALPVAAGIVSVRILASRHLAGDLRRRAVAAAGVAGCAYAAAQHPAWLVLVVFVSTGFLGSFVWRAGAGRSLPWAEAFLTVLGAGLTVLAASRTVPIGVFVASAAAGHAAVLAYTASGYRVARKEWSAAPLATTAFGVALSVLSLFSVAGLRVPPDMMLACAAAMYVLVPVVTADVAEAGGFGRGRDAPARTSQAEIRKERLVHSGVLAAGMAHDVKNVLARMELTAEAGLAGSQTAAKDQALQAVAADCRGVAGALSGLLAGHGAFLDGAARATDLPADLIPILGVLQTHCRRSGVEVVVRSFDACRVLIDSGDLAHVITTLVLNGQEAVAHRADRQRSVTLSGVARQGLYYLDVWDTGPGIPESHVEQAFLPGYSTGEGTGMGLYIARVLAEQNGGSLEYLAVDGQWSFRLTLAEVPE